MTLDDLLWECLRFFAHRDAMNSAIHCAGVRYSPITFRLAEALLTRRLTEGWRNSEAEELVALVLADAGTYEEDTGR